VNTKNPEPRIKEGGCAYCGDAQINHHLAYWQSLFFEPFDDHVVRISHRAPRFLKKIVDGFLLVLLKILEFLHLAKYSSDIEKVKTFRSRVIWGEALRQGIPMEQLILFGKYLDFYRAKIQGKTIYFESLPLPITEMRRDWDNKYILKEEFSRVGIPTPRYALAKNVERIFKDFDKPLIVKPKAGSRGRHTLTHIRTLSDLKKSLQIARQISPYLVVEEHLLGPVCRVTLVGGKIAGFYRGEAPEVVGDGVHTIRELIEEKNHTRPDRVEKVREGGELEGILQRQGLESNDVLSVGQRVFLSHRIGRLFGGRTREMLDDLHPSFIPIFEKAARVTGLAVVGFDAIIPDPTAPAEGQRWGIIEANTLSFIDLHYYALEGKPKNIAGMIWDLVNAQL